LKRVNAHLANPDYVVPGMKIFLPKKKATTQPSEKGREKMPEKVKPQQSAPAPTPTPAPSKPPAMEKPSKPQQPIQLPEFEMPKPPAVPKSTPPIPSAPVQQQPAAPMPKPAEPMPMPSIPPAAPTPPMAMPQFFQPIMPVPCGWMPIYDADCVPMPFPSFPQQMPFPAMPQVSPTQVMPSQEMQMPPAHLGVKPPNIDMTDELDDYDESPIYPGSGPGVSPPYPVRGWELTESPMMESPMMESPMLESPMMENESPSYYPHEQSYVPQLTSPEFQQPYGMMQAQQPFAFSNPCMPMHHCGCGCHSQGFYGGAPIEMQPNYMMPMQASPMQMYPSQAFPTQAYPAQSHPAQMYPMQMYPMHMQPFQHMDNCGCGR
jgi:morphogenetic protein associated with SpoVID